jgi:hypothetical protein
MSKIDMKALYKVSRGDPEKQISITKAWLGTVIAILEQRTSYDTSGLRALATPNGEPKVTVRRQWLAHIHDVLNKAEHETTSTNMSPAAERDFDTAFSHLDTAFAYIDRAFRHMPRKH